MLAVVFLPVQTGVALAIMLSLIHGVFTTTRTRLIEFERLPGSSVWWPESRTIAGEKLLGCWWSHFRRRCPSNAYQFQHDLQTAIERAGEG